MEFTGTVGYTGRPDGTTAVVRLHFKSLKMNDDSISFNAESESEEYGLWELRGKAYENDEGGYVAKKCRWEQDCEAGDFATVIIHRIDISADNSACDIAGRIKDDDGVWPFEGSLTSVNGRADMKKEDAVREEVMAVEAKRELPAVQKAIVAPLRELPANESSEALAVPEVSSKPLKGIGVFKVLFWSVLAYWMMKGFSTLPGLLEAGIGFKSLLKAGMGVILPIYLLIKHKAVFAWWAKTKIEIEEEAKEKERLDKIKRQQEREEKIYLCLRLLYLFSMLDGEVDPNDSKIIKRYLLLISHEEEIKTIAKNNSEKLNSNDISEDDLDALISRLKSLLSKDERVTFIETCKKIIHADGEINDTEREMFGHVRKELLSEDSDDDWVCPNCGSDNFAKISEEEADRWRARKNVKELSARGNVMIKNVSVTKVTIESNWQCSDCENEWTTTVEEEKT